MDETLQNAQDEALRQAQDEAMQELQRQDFVGRIWKRDHTLWKDDPREIANRLGWLDVAAQMTPLAPDLESFAREVKEEGVRHIVLLGMGGSSLGPAVLRGAFGSAAGYPELVVLDSTLPDVVAAVERSLDLTRTVFLVSSKSGDTIESISLYRYFRSLLDKAIGVSQAGKNFVAITDPGSPLVALAEERGFRRVFLNPPDIGGRYSVLSYFGLAPAALMDVNIREMLDRAKEMGDRCRSVDIHNNPGLWLGAAIGAMARQGRDKLTFLVSPSIGAFGLWAEQLLAESLGKEAKGIVPVVGEPMLSPEKYGADRLFVYLRLQSDDNADMDSSVEQIRAAGHPVVDIPLSDRSDLGAEFYRWQFATAVIGSILGVNPFDQPDVEAAKEMTGRLLEEYHKTRRLLARETSGSLAGLTSQVRPGDYLAVLAYLSPTIEVDDALDGLLRRVAERYKIATTVGYGPRYLHSTGQLHKGGPDIGLFLLLTADHDLDLAIPGEAHTFGVLADAQASGDLQALQLRGRRVFRLHLKGDPVDGIRGLAQEI